MESSVFHQVTSTSSPANPSLQICSKTRKPWLKGCQVRKLLGCLGFLDPFERHPEMLSRRTSTIPNGAKLVEPEICSKTLDFELTEVRTLWFVQKPVLE